MDSGGHATEPLQYSQLPPTAKSPWPTQPINRCLPGPDV